MALLLALEHWGGTMPENGVGKRRAAAAKSDQSISLLALILCPLCTAAAASVVAIDIRAPLFFAASIATAAADHESWPAKERKKSCLFLFLLSQFWVLASSAAAKNDNIFSLCAPSTVMNFAGEFGGLTD